MAADYSRAMLATVVLASTMALTFDDIPGSSMPRADRCQSAAMLRWNEKLLATLAAHHAPALGFVNASRSCAGLTPILNAWLERGHDLGNHTWSHRDINSTPLGEYEEDIIAGETPLRDVLVRHGKTLRYFRHPALHTGNTPAVHRALADFLRERGYVVAPVTIDDQDFVFANAYAGALQGHDAAAARRIRQAYVPYMESVVAFFETRTRAVLGRDIPQIILLHMSSLNADALDALLGMLERRGYRFITMDEALRDPAYELGDHYVGPKGLSWIHRWGLAKGMPVVEEPREPAWLRATTSSSP